jgi:hypothetical protein
VITLYDRLPFGILYCCEWELKVSFLMGLINERTIEEGSKDWNIYRQCAEKALRVV